MSVPVQAFNFVTALNPFSPTVDEDNQRDVKKRPRGPTQKAMDPVSRPQEYLGTSGGFGFTKKNELFVGRVAMLVWILCPSSWNDGHLQQTLWAIVDSQLLSTCVLGYTTLCKHAPTCTVWRAGA